MSLINVGELAKPAMVLIEKISEAVGAIFKPHQMRRVAQANADAALICAQSEITITDLHRRAMHRFLNEEAKKQENIEEITKKALPQLEGRSNPQDMDNDWILNFFNRCRVVSDDQMQQLWSKVLAGEANSPGTYSKRTVNFIESLDKHDAILFSKLCSFGWTAGDFFPLIYDAQHSVYRNEGITFSALTHLDDIGLVTFQHLGHFQRKQTPKRISLSYFGTQVQIEFPKAEDNTFELGTIMLTQVGQQLALVCSPSPVADFIDYVLQRWVERSYVVASPCPFDSAVS